MTYVSAYEQLVARAVTVPCPDCGVGVNKLCLTNAGKIARYPHSKRVSRANDAERRAREVADRG